MEDKEDKSPYKASIHCITYNQSAYITDAMNGFAMQQTNFPFVAVIIDDASTDGEQEVKSPISKSILTIRKRQDLGNGKRRMHVGYLPAIN